MDSLKILENVSLKLYTTMRLGGPARYLVEVHANDDVPKAIAWAKDHQQPVLVIGGGSNTVFKDEGFNGLVIVNKILGYDVIDEADDTILIRIGAGENWDTVVAETVIRGYAGIESMSLIPGTAGGTPVTNVGAYGQEIADTLEWLEAYSLKEEQFVRFKNEECDFSYRNSRFKVRDHGKYVIVNIVLRLSKRGPKKPSYKSLIEELDRQKIAEPSLHDIRQAVIAIRNRKLPDPAEVANCGSFFKNPIIPRAQYEELVQSFPDIQANMLPDDDVKIYGGWLIENAGLKGYAAHGIKIYDKQALVLVNENARTTQDLLDVKAHIISTVKDKFGITLEQEPELLP